MNLRILNNRVYIGVSFNLSSFSEMIESHGDNFQDTLEMEDRYKDLINSPIDEYDSIAEYIKTVSKWGNYAGVGGKVLKNNTAEKIIAVFEAVRNILNSESPDLSLALSRINTLYGLGMPSFASKHLRFMLPEKCPVYDSILTDVLPYSFDPSGYATFAEDCKSLSIELCSRNIENPIRKSVTWYAGDVEAAIFSQFYDQ